MFHKCLEAYDGEINLAFDENLISNKYAVKLCLDYEDDFEKTEKSPDDWDQLLDFNFDDVPKFGEELPLLVFKMGKSNRNKKRSMENLSLFYQDIGPSLSASDHLTQEKAAKEALAMRIGQKFASLEEVRPVIEKMAYHDKYKNILDEIWKDTTELDGKIVKEEEEAIKRIIADTGSDSNTMPYRIYEILRREEMKKDVLNIMGCDEEIDNMLRIRLREAGSDEEILILLDFARKLGLYQLAELDEEGFNIYFEGDDLLRSLSAPDYYRDLDTTTLMELIDTKSRRIPEDPHPGVPRVERMEYRQSYHWDRYQGVFEHMAGVYNVLLQRAYNPPGYAQPQYDQYYQQYPPLPPQYHQQQDDDEYPSVVRSYRGNRYTLAIVDDYLDTSTYILNRILIRAILGKTPYELLRGMKPTLDYFRVFGRKCFILNTKDYLTKFDPESYECVFLDYSENSKAYIILDKNTRKIKESLNVTFNETPPPSKTSPLVDDDLDREEAIKVTEKKILENDIEDETLEIDEIVNFKESRNHTLENVIGNLNQRTLRSQAQNQSNFFCFISTIKPKNVNEALTDESWKITM
nr:retrovirus-related Pol polyprotein from transposon TNT 1-94 [Tanacetum cinerariifolium]